MDRNENKFAMPEILLLLLIGLAAGVLSGVVGIGGGIIMVPALVFLVGFSQHMAQGTSLAMMIPPIGILAVMNYYKQGMVDVRVAGILVVGFFFGAFFGSKIALSLPEDVLKKVFGFVMLAAAIKLIFTK